MKTIAYKNGLIMIEHIQHIKLELNSIIFQMRDSQTLAVDYSDASDARRSYLALKDTFEQLD